MFRPAAQKAKTIKIGLKVEDLDKIKNKKGQNDQNSPKRQKTHAIFHRQFDDEISLSENSQEIRKRAQREVQMFYKGQYKNSLIMNLMQERFYTIFTRKIQNNKPVNRKRNIWNQVIKDEQLNGLVNEYLTYAAITKT